MKNATYVRVHTFCACGDYICCEGGEWTDVERAEMAGLVGQPYASQMGNALTEHGWKEKGGVWSCPDCNANSMTEK